MPEKDYFYTGYNSCNNPKARLLRREMTKQEKKLWYQYLKKYEIHWYRQRPIDHYIVDFYCSRAKLVLELDGSQHYTVEGEEYDAIRTDILEAYQLEVIRLPNAEIDKNFSGVCQLIDWTVEKRLKIL